MCTRRKWARIVPVVLTFGILLSFGGRGTVSRADDSAEDPEYGSTFGRVRFLDGSMTLQRTSQGDLTDATVNDPVVPGDRLGTEDGRAEIGMSDGSTLWLDRSTRLTVRNLADIDNRYESTNLLALEGGAVRIEAPDSENENKTFRVDTEAGSVYLLSGGSFRIETDEGVVTLYSFRGVAELSGDDGSVLVRSGERGSVQPGRAPSEPRRFNTAGLDDFDRFCEDRLGAYLRRDRDEPVDRIVEEVPYEVHPYISELSSYGSCPLNYYNRPVFQDTTIVNVVNVNVTRLQPRGWRFVPVGQFSNPRAPRSAVGVDRLPRGTDVVLTSRLPRFDPRDIAGRPERGARFVETVRQNRSPLPVVVGRDNKPLPFRSAERSAGETRARRGAASASPQERSRLQQPRPAVRPGVPAVGPGRNQRRPGDTAQPRGRPAWVPREGARPQAGPRVVPGEPDRSRGRESAPSRQRTAPPARDQGQRREYAAPPARAPEPPRNPPRSKPQENDDKGKGH